VNEPVAPLDVSVVVPVRNGARYLATALDSVLGQSPAPREIVVVDDGSTDDTAAVMDRYRDRIIARHQPLTGFAAALNHGIRATTSTWVGFVDADDEWTPTALGDRWAPIAARTDVDLVSGQVVQFVSPELPDETAARFRFDPAPSRGQVFGAVLVRRATLIDVGPLDEALPTATTLDWISRARAAGVRMKEIDDVVLLRRLHGANMGVTMDRDVTTHALLDVVRAHHARRRSQDCP
jgi:glycosyltransferase involved in cell wall biosynthesis